MINFGDSNILVQYIQNFLKDNYDKYIQLSDEYDKNTHESLINYLLLPELVDSYTMKDILLNAFTFREEQPPNKLIDGGGIWNFDYKLTPDTIKFYNRPINECFDGGLKFINKYKNDIENECNKHGWHLIDYTSFNYDKNESTLKQVEFIVSKENRQQILPSKDIIKMINFSMNNYLLGKCFLDENNSYHGFIQNSNNYKISYIKAKPGDVFTISHGYKYACELAIGYTENELTELKNEDLSSVKNIVSHLSKSKYGELNPGDYEVYKIPEDSKCTYLLIQMPYKNNLISPTSKKINVKLGDINQDGNITFDINDPDSDYSLLKQYVEATSNGEKPQRNLSGINLIAANLNRDVDINGKPIVDRTDLMKFEAAIEAFNNFGKSIDFGEAIYEKEIDLSESDYDRLLVMYGDITINNKNNILNIPIEEYQTNPWAIHECFLPYILGSVIHPYSKTKDIEWLQNTILTVDARYKPLRWGLYDSLKSYISNDYFKWNESKSLYEYYQNGLYTGYVLTTNDIFNSEMRRETNMTLVDIKIINGRIISNNEWTGQYVMTNGIISNGNANHCLQEKIKLFQIGNNINYKNHSKEQIRFINGYVDPLTEHKLKLIIQ